MGLIAAFVSRTSFGWFDFQFVLVCHGLDQIKCYFQAQKAVFRVGLRC